MPTQGILGLASGLPISAESVLCDVKPVGKTCLVCVPLLNPGQVEALAWVPRETFS